MYLFTAKVQSTQRVKYFLFSGEMPQKVKNRPVKVNLITRAIIFETYVKLELFSKIVLFYSLPFILSSGIFGEPTAKNKKKTSLRSSRLAVKTI